jgi:hypothetical protein
MAGKIDNCKIEGVEGTTDVVAAFAVATAEFKAGA